jgi:hypothetical protein
MLHTTCKRKYIQCTMCTGIGALSISFLANTWSFTPFRTTTRTNRSVRKYKKKNSTTRIVRGRQHECLRFLGPRLDHAWEFLRMTISIRIVAQGSPSTIRNSCPHPATPKRKTKLVQKKKSQKIHLKKNKSRDSRRESGLINLFRDDLPPMLVQRGGNIKRGQDGSDRDPVRGSAHEPAGANAPSVSECDVGCAQRCAPSGQIAFGDEALRVRTYVYFVVQQSASRKRKRDTRRYMNVVACAC